MSLVDTGQMAVAALGLPVIAGCAEISGVDDYGIAGPPEATLCPSPEAPAGPNGECVTVGVRDCGEFEPDGRGGCESPPLATPCRPGFRRVPGTTECSGVPSVCYPEFFEALAPPDGWLFVKPNTPAGGNGQTRQTPFKTIREALEAVGPDTVGIALAVGEYVEAVEINRPLKLFGACAGPEEHRPPSRIRAPSGSTGPVVKFSLTEPGKAEISLVEVTGGTTGIFAEGPVTLNLGAAWVHDVDGPGVHLDEGVKAFAAGLLVENTLGAGIELEGATLTSRHTVESWTSVRRTRSLPDGRGGYGIALFASRKLVGVPNEVPDVPFRYGSVRAEITLDGAELEDNAGAGLFIEGSAAVIDRTIIRDTLPNGLREGRGVVVQKRALGATSASLRLERSLIENSSDAGVLIIDSPATVDGTFGVSVNIKNTTIRNVSGADSEIESGLCLGNGVRVRGDRASSEPTITIGNSLIAGAREAAVHVQGARVEVSDSIVRGTAGCGADYGDGIAVLGDAMLPAAATLSGSRIEANARSAIANFGAELSISGCVIDGSDGRHVAKVARGGIQPIVHPSGNACAVDATGAPCRIQEEALVAPLVGGNGCAAFADEGVCYRLCLDDANTRLAAPEVDRQRPVAPLSGTVFWVPDALQIAPALTAEETGCLEWGGLRRNSPARVWASARDGYFPFAWWQSTSSGDAPPARLGMVSDSVASAVANLAKQDWNARLSTWINVAISHPPEAGFENTPTELWSGRGVVGVELQAETADVAGPWYVTPGPLPSIQQDGGITSASFGIFVNASPGEVIVRLLPPPSHKSIECKADAFGTGWSTADLVAPDRVRLPARRGFGATAALFCTLK